MSANPPDPTPIPVTIIPPVGPVPVAWYNSQKFKAYVGSWLVLVIGWMTQCLSSNAWEWKALAVSSLGMVSLVVNDWRRAEIIAPIDALNRKNFPPWSPTP